VSENYLTVAEIARLYGIGTRTITSYKARGKMPQPDLQVGRTPVWKLSTLTEWRTPPAHTKG
jgi:hypothetical protein